MTNYIDKTFWRNALCEPSWYLLLKDDFERLEKLARKENDYLKRKRIKDEAYNLVEDAIREGRLPMAKTGDNLDVERKPIDTIIIHHTKNKPGMTLERLNAMHLLRIYSPHFANQSGTLADGQPAWSGHFYNARQVFWGYHWLIRKDGASERILNDSYIGWHAGNWDVNTRSVGICIDDDLSNKEPSETVVQALADTIKQHYPHVAPSRILGHCEVNTHTECPGHLFAERWKQKLVDTFVH